MLEGGVRPGEVLASIPIAGTAPTFAFQAPPGAFYIRLRTVSGASTSRPSGEIRLYVGAYSGPTAPRSLTAYGNGSSVVLDWRNTFGGGEPAGIVVDVTQDGARVASIPMPLTSTWRYDAVPAGTFGFTVRATNASGTSGSSNSVTLTFPLSGCSAPSSPESFSVAANGRHGIGPLAGAFVGHDAHHLCGGGTAPEFERVFDGPRDLPGDDDHHFEPGGPRHLRGPRQVREHLRQQQQQQLAVRDGAIGAAMGHAHDVPARRNFLKLSARLAALGLTSLGVQPARQFFVRDVEGQGRITDYKALVCVYLFGGNDANNLIVPADNYTAYSSARGGTDGVALAANTLLPIPGSSGATYGLHPSLTDLAPIYNAGYLSFVLNMGALNRPLTKTEYQSGASRPPNLFSHSDQHDAGPDWIGDAAHRVGRAAARSLRGDRLARRPYPCPRRPCSSTAPTFAATSSRPVRISGCTA